jgi:hypothetical protein
VICGIAADVNYDGVDEVVIGTYGQSVMVYAQKEKEAGMCHDSGLWVLTLRTAAFPFIQSAHKMYATRIDMIPWRKI